MCGSDRAALDAAAALLDRGFLVPAIRPPTVPPGTARLRIVCSAADTTEQVDALRAALHHTGLPGRRLGPLCGTQTTPDGGGSMC